MRFGLVVLGIIFLVLGAVVYFYPSQSFSAQTDSSSDGTINPTTTSAAFSIPVEWSYALLAMGFLFLLFGLVMPSPNRIVPGPVRYVSGPRGPRGKSVRTVRTIRSYRPRRKPRRARRRPLARGTSITTTTTRTRR